MCGPAILYLTLLFHLGAPLSGTEFQIKPLKFNPGLYFERLPDIRTYHVEWRLITSIEIGKFILQEPDLTQAKLDAEEQCKKAKVMLCEATQEISHMQSILGNAARYKEQLMGLIDNRNLFRRNRGAPIGFIGTISKALFGTMNEDDAAYYNTEIDKLHADEKRISELLANQTHILNTELNDIHGHLQNLTSQTQNLRKIAEATVETIKNQQTEIDRFKWRQAQSKWLSALNGAVNEYCSGLIQLSDAIMFASQGIIHPALLPPHQLATAAEKIQSDSSLEFPLTGNELLSEQFSKIAKLKLSAVKERLILELSFPLLDKESLKVYRMHICPSSQLYSANLTVFAYIVPQATHVAISQNQQFYFFFSEQYLKNCRQHLNQYLCELNLPIHKTSEAPTCETSLITHSPDFQWNLCDVRIFRTKETFWERLESSNIWLYSTIHPEEIQIICEGHIIEYEHLKGAGTLQLSPGCETKTTTTRLIAFNRLTTQTSMEYSVPISLNISQFNPEITPQHIETILKVNGPARAQSPTMSWKDSSAAISLNAIEAQAKELSTHQRSHKETQIITYSSMGLGTIITIGIIIYITYKFLRRIYHPYAVPIPVHRREQRPDITLLPMIPITPPELPPPRVPQITLPRPASLENFSIV